MATYQVKDKEGTTYKVKGPAGATEEQLINAVMAQKSRDKITGIRAELEELRANRFIPEPEEEDTTLIGNILRGVPAGFVQGLEIGAIGLTEPLGEETQQSARDIIRGVADAVKPELANPEEVSAKIAQGIGSFASLAPMLLAGPAAIVAVPAFAAAMGVGEASERARAAGATPEERTKAAALGIFPGLLDVIPFARVSRKFAPALNDVVSKIGPRELSDWKSRIQRAAVTGGIEGAQETAQGLVQNAIEKGVYNPDRAILTREPLEEGGIGLSAGFIIQGLLDAFVGRKRDFDAAPETPEAPEAPEAPAQGELFGPAPIPVAPPRASETLLAEQLRAEEGIPTTEQDRDAVRREAAAINPTVSLTEAEIDAELTRLQTDYTNKKYQRDRAAEYPSMVDQLDDIYHNGIDAWKATIKTTKDKYPKP